jgi:hypothetical protein
MNRLSFSIVELIYAHHISKFKISKQIRRFSLQCVHCSYTHTGSCKNVRFLMILFIKIIYASELHNKQFIIFIADHDAIVKQDH